MNIKDRTFKHWKIDDVKFELGLKQKTECELLEEWLDVNIEVEDWQLETIERLLKKARPLIALWNETELQTKFVAPITEMVDFDNLTYFFSSFSERRLDTKFEGIPLKGKVDWMVAIGQQEPRMPFFFIHEYKKQEGYANDPQGQLLATMLAAHVLNQTPPRPTLFNPYPKHDKNMPIYGCYIIGRWWYFVVLHKGGFCKSEPFDSLQKDILLRILNILKKQKRMIINRLEAAKSNTD